MAVIKKSIELNVPVRTAYPNRTSNVQPVLCGLKEYSYIEDKMVTVTTFGLLQRRSQGSE